MLIGSKSGTPTWLTGNLQGMGWMLLTGMLIVSMHAMIRHLAADMHPFEIGFFRTAFGAPIVGILLWKYGWGILRTDQLKGHGIRSIGHVIAMMMFFTGLTMTPLATANALAFTAPLFAAVLAVLILREVFRWQRWAALLFGFAMIFVAIVVRFRSHVKGTLVSELDTLIQEHSDDDPAASDGAKN